MKKKESDFNTLFRCELEKFRFTFFRVESHATSPGMPDNHYIFNPSGQSGWIEIKQEVTMPNSIYYQRNQPAWLKAYADRNGTAWTVMYVADENAVLMVPGNESFKAAKDLSKAHRLLFKLAKPDAWPQIALILHGWAPAEWINRENSPKPVLVSR